MSSNVFARLSRLGNIPTKRRVAEPDDLEEEEAFSPDLSRVANEEMNLPEPTAEGGVSPASYDVRANEVIEPESQGSDFYRRIGERLGTVARQNQTPEAIPEEIEEPVAAPAPIAASPEAPAEEGQPSFLSRLGRGLQEMIHSNPLGRGVSGLVNEVKSLSSPEHKEEMARNLAKMETPDLNLGAEEYAQRNAPGLVAERGEEIRVDNEDIAKAMENPFTRGAYGSADEIARSPELQKRFEEVTGIDWNPQVDAEVKRYEAVISEIDDNLSNIASSSDEQMKRIKERIEKNQATDNDKYYIGLALLLPLIIGGAFGAEAGLATLGGAAQGLGNIYERRQKEIAEGEEQLGQLSKQRSATELERGNLQIKRSQIPQQIRENLPEDQEAHLKGMRRAVLTDPETGEETTGIEIKPGLVAKPQYVANNEALKDIRKAANDLQPALTFTNEVNDLTDDIIHIVSQLKDKNVFSKYFTNLIAGKAPGSLSTLTQDVDFEGNKVNAGQLLEQKLGFLANAYGQAKSLGQLDRAAQNHIQKIFTNPTSTLSTAKDALHQMLEVRKLVQRGILNQAENAGFDSRFLADEIGKKNRGLYNRLNKKSEEKRVDEITKKIIGS